MSETEKVIVYSSYTPAQKKATKKYRTENKEKVNEQRKKYYKERVEKDPKFLDYKREKAKEYYTRKKMSKKPSEEDTQRTEDEKAEREKSVSIDAPPQPPTIEIPKPKLTRQKQVTGPVLDEEQKKAIKTISKLMKDGIIDDTKYQEAKTLITDKKPLQLEWLDKKGKLKRLAYLIECTPKPVSEIVVESEPDVPTDIDKDLKDEIKQVCKEEKVKKARTRKPKASPEKKE